MKVIPVKSASGDYKIYVGTHLLNHAGKLVRGVFHRRHSRLPAKAMIVTQESIAKHHLASIYRALESKGFRLFIHMLPAGERAKSEKELFRLFRALVSHEFERNDLIFALGGGVVGDLSGFAAASFLRGIPFINAGTTLLAQVDSSIGGKTGINLAEGKNLVGAFYPPKIVLTDISVLQTLPSREFYAAMGEVIKYGMIRDAALFRKLEGLTPSALMRQPRELSSVVEACARIKANIVSRDEHETKGARMMLNYGHTFGHAIEQGLRYKRLLHGEAVAIGMVAAARLAVYLKMLTPEFEMRQRKLLEKFQLPTSIKRYGLKAEILITAMMRDKKRSAGKLRFVLPVSIGQVETRDDVPAAVVRKVLLEMGSK